jgi:DNA uptake protein ComE-like DNA-binding protein
MSNFSSNKNKTPNWVWFSFIPVFGGLAIAYAGNKVGKTNWIWLGIGFIALSIIFASTELAVIIWLAQIGMAFYLKPQFSLPTTTQKLLTIPDRETAKIIALKKGKLDVNTCSKNELVYDLGLPIVYANDIDSVRNEGYMFTSIEELHEIAGIPENYLRKIEPLLAFGYHAHKEAEVSWRRLNSYSVTELIEVGISAEIAQKIVTEREKKGYYLSVIEVKNRTGIPLRYYQNLI